MNKSAKSENLLFAGTANQREKLGTALRFSRDKDTTAVGQSQSAALKGQ
jgi:hypothetical protein